MDRTVKNTECGDWTMSDDDFLTTFTLPRRTPDQLARRHPFPREDRLFFDAASHKYFLDGRQIPISVTGLLHKYSSGFNPTAALAAMRGGFDWASKEAELQARGLGTTDEDFLARWQSNGQVASARGTLMRREIKGRQGSGS